MATLLALDLPLGPDLESAVRRCVEEGQAFCVLDQRLSASRRRGELEVLGATHVLDAAGRRALNEGADVSPDVGVVMLTSGWSRLNTSRRRLVISWSHTSPAQKA